MGTWNIDAYEGSPSESEAVETVGTVEADSATAALDAYNAGLDEPLPRHQDGTALVDEDGRTLHPVAIE